MIRRIELRKRSIQKSLTISMNKRTERKLPYKIRFKWFLMMAQILNCFFMLGCIGFRAERNWTTLVVGPDNGPKAYFWSGIKFGDKIFGGTHGPGTGFQIWSYPPASSFIREGETAFSFCEFQGSLYSTNETLQLWQLVDGDWQKIIDLNPPAGNFTLDNIRVSHFFGLTSFSYRGIDYLYLKAYDWAEDTKKTYFFRSTDGVTWKKVDETDRFEGVSFVYKKELYSVGKGVVDHYSHEGPLVGRRSSDGIAFEDVTALMPGYNSEYMFGYEDPVPGGLLILGSGGAHYVPEYPAQIHFFDGVNRWVAFEDRELFKFTSAVRIGKKLYVLGDSGYEAGSGFSKLYEYDGITWTLTQQFDFACATALVNFDGALVVFGGQSGEGSFGKIVRFSPNSHDR